MAEDKTRTVSSVIAHENELDLIVNELIEKAVARHDISIQGRIRANGKHGKTSVNPTLVQHSDHPPKTEPFLHDDFWWAVGFSFAIPVVISVVIGIFFIGDFRDSSDNIFYGIAGLLVGSFIGWRISARLRKKHYGRIAEQEEQGGFLLWVTAHSLNQEKAILDILKAYKATNIEVTDHLTV